MSVPHVAVIIPHFGCEEFLARAVASVLRQTWTDLVLYVVDDASADERWLDALRPFADDSRLHALRTSRNVGHYRIKNTLLEMIESPWIALQDADDESHPERLARQLHLAGRSGAGLVGTGFRRVDAQGRELSRRRMPRLASLWMRLGKKFAVLHPTSLIRREVLVEMGGFDGTATVAADADFLLRAAHVCRIRNVPRILYDYRQRPSSLMGGAHTGPGSALRDAYIAHMRQREAARRKLRGAALSESLRAPANDVAFRIEPISLR